MERIEGGHEDEVESPCSYEPIRTFEELMNYGQGSCGIAPRACQTKTRPLSSGFSDIKVSLDGRRIHKSQTPRLIVCHDFKGGYVQDK